MGKLPIYQLRRFCLESFYILLPFFDQIYPRLVSILDMNSTSFTSVNNSKICDWYAAVFYTNILRNTAFKRANKPLRRAIKLLWRANKPLGRAKQSASEITTISSEIKSISLLVSKRKVKIMFSKSSMGNKQVCYFPLLAKFPSKCVSLVSKCAMRLPSLATLVYVRCEKHRFVDYAVNSGLFLHKKTIYPACKLHSAISR